MTNEDLINAARRNASLAMQSIDGWWTRQGKAIPRSEFYETMRQLSAASCALQEIECRSRCEIEPIWRL